jgi:hypothetical protein
MANSLHMQLARSNQSLIYLMEPMMQMAASNGFEGIEIAGTDEGNLSIVVEDMDSELVEAIAYSLLESAGFNDEADFEIDANENGVTISVASWEYEEIAKRSMDVEDDGDMDENEEEEDESSDDDEEEEVTDKSNVTEDTDVIARSKVKKKNSPTKLKILTTPETQKIANRLYGLSGGDDMAHFPSFWSELDALCQKYRGETGYQPDYNDDSESSANKAIASDIASHAASYLETARKKKKGAKKEWTKGRGGFLTALMRAIAKNGTAIDTAWDNVDIEAMVPLVTKLGQRVIDAMAAQAEKIGKEIPEAKEDEADTE